MRPFYPYASNYRSLSGPIEWYQTQISGIIGVFGTENGPNGPHGSHLSNKRKRGDSYESYPFIHRMHTFCTFTGHSLTTSIFPSASTGAFKLRPSYPNLAGSHDHTHVWTPSMRLLTA